MSDNTQNNISGVKDFINEHLVKILWGVALYFIVGLSNDFKDVKLTLQQLLINQATMEQRMSAIETINARQDAKLEAYDKSVADFYQTYKLTKK